MSSKKLQNLLNPSPISSKDQSRPAPSTNNKTPLSRTNSSTPLATIPSSGATGIPPAYQILPKNQNIFYNPTVKTEQAICPSPMIQFPLRVLSREHIVEATTGLLFGPERAINNEQKLTEKPEKQNDVSASLNSIFQQLQEQFPSQPKNLEELLQRSFSSMPSNSLFQTSFNSAMPSPYVSHATPNSHFHMSAVSEVSKGYNSGLLGTPLQRTPLFKGKQATSQSLEVSQSILISQIAELLKHKSEVKIRTAIAELLMKYKALGIVTDQTLEKEISNLQGIVKVGGTNYPQENPLRNQPPQIINPQGNTLFQQVENRGIYKSNAKGIPELLSKIPKKLEYPQGFSLVSQLNTGPLKKIDEIKNNGGSTEHKNYIPPSKVDAARRELFDLEAIPEKRNSTMVTVQTNILKEDPVSISNEQKKKLSESENYNEESSGGEQKQKKKRKIASEKIKAKNTGIGRKIRIKGKGTTAEEYMEYRESQVKVHHDDKRLNHTMPLFEDSANESTMYYENNRSMLDRGTLTGQGFL